MIQVNNLTKIYKTYEKSGNILTDFFNRQYKQVKAVDNISFQLETNTLVGFIGPNGAGKTTTMKMLSGILYPSSGTINVLGYNPFEKKPDFLKQIAFIMGQKNQLLWELPATDSFRLNKEIYEIEDNVYKNTVNELVELLNCQSFLSQPVKTLSLGQRMRLELINSLLHLPKILFLDEPTIGLDIFAQTTIINFIKEYQNRYHSSVLLTSHYMQDVQKLANRIIIVNLGKIIFDGKLMDLIKQFSQEKTVVITLNKPISQDFSLPENIEIDYNYPLLKLKLKKDEINHILSLILKKCEFVDLTIEDESIEEIITNR